MATKKKSNVYSYPDPDSTGVDKVIAANPNRPKSIREQQEEKRKAAAKKGGKK